MSTGSNSLFSNSRFTLLGSLLCAVLVGWIAYEMNGRIKMATTHAHFAEAIRLAEQNMPLHAPHESRVQLNAQGIPTLNARPQSTGEWIAHYHRSIRQAPGGGPAFIVNTTGNPMTGAIGVSATNYGSELHLSRPAYRTLTSHKIVVHAQEKQLAGS